MIYREYREPGYVIASGYDKQLALESVNIGWSSLIEELFSFIETHKITAKIIQVKEKWGGLRIYTDVIDTGLDSKIIELEMRSFKLCEICGKDGKLRSDGWYKVFCDEHANGRKAVREF